MLEFDEATGLLRAEAGLRLGHLVDLFLPRGFFVPVSPGTADVTLGGMVAADVHGKNHCVAGTIGAWIHAIRLRLPDASVRSLTSVDGTDLFDATLGGMGLTGHVLDVTLALERVPSPSIFEESRSCCDLESLIAVLDESSAKWPFTVAWSDWLAGGSSFGRGVVQCGRWATQGEAGDARGCALPRLTVPTVAPSWLLNRQAIAAFHALRYELATRDGACRVRPARSFFYPLDAVGAWNLLYGRRGMMQYHCVLPRDPSMRSVRRLVEAATSGETPPFLAVIKTCGDQGRGMLSFPMPGISFALDYPVAADSAALVARMNDVVAAAGGRIYLAKDLLTTPEAFAAMEPRLPRFLALRQRIDPDARITSALAERLFPRR